MRPLARFRDLRLIVRRNEMGRFEKTRPLDAVPIEAFLACVANITRQNETDSVGFAELMRLGVMALRAPLVSEATK